MIKVLTQNESLCLTLKAVLNGNNDDILKWMSDFSQALLIQSVEQQRHHNPAFLNATNMANIGKTLSTLHIPNGFDFQPFLQEFEKTGWRPFPVRSEYNLIERTDMGEFIIRSVLSLYDDAATHPELSRTENGLILRDYRANEHLPTSIIKASHNKTPAQRLAKTMARPNNFHT